MRRKYKVRMYLWLCIIAFIFLLIKIWDYINHNIVPLSPGIRLIIDSFIIVIVAICIAIILKVTITRFKQQWAKPADYK